MELFPICYDESMKKTQKGFSAVEALVIVLIVALLGFAGWFVWHSKQKDTPVSKSTTSQNSAAKKQAASTTPAKIDTTITTVDLAFRTEADLSKLPSVAPASFKAYLSEKLKANVADTSGCIEVFTISKISSVNIAGGGHSESKSGEDTSCMGGAPRVWVLTPGGTWDDETLNGPVCKSKNGGLVYEEFAAKCYTDKNTDSYVDNPNGSITSLSQ